MYQRPERIGQICKCGHHWDYHVALPNNLKFNCKILMPTGYTDYFCNCNWFDNGDV